MLLFSYTILIVPWTTSLYNSKVSLTLKEWVKELKYKFPRGEKKTNFPAMYLHQKSWINISFLYYSHWNKDIESQM